MGIERELKLTLTEGEAARLAVALDPPLRIVHQRNHYLDTPEGTLRRQRHGLRLREENGEIRLTLKGPARVAGGMIERLELEARIAQAEADLLLAGRRCLAELPLSIPQALKDEAGARPLLALGMIENERRIYGLLVPGDSDHEAIEAEVDLDRTRYPDESVEYELEVEWPHPAVPFPTSAVRDLLERTGVPWRPGGKSKFARFLERSGR